MGAVKRTHKRARCGQVSEKYAKRMCDRHGIRPRTAEAYLRATRPAWFNALSDWCMYFADNIVKACMPMITDIAKAVKQISEVQTEVTHDRESRTGT